MDLGYVMAEAGTHYNRKTGEWLSQNVQVCPMCYRNFASNRAGDKHWDRKKPRGHQCLIPEEVGLSSFTNAHGAIIYRIKVEESSALVEENSP